jgi:hypothetical protein
LLLLPQRQHMGRRTLLLACWLLLLPCRYMLRTALPLPLAILLLLCGSPGASSVQCWKWRWAAARDTCLRCCRWLCPLLLQLLLLQLLVLVLLPSVGQGLRCCHSSLC